MENNPHQKSKYSYECHYIMKDININANLLHDNLLCEYVSIHSHEKDSPPPIDHRSM